MAYDGFVTRCVVKELSDTIVGGKVDKVYQPEKDEIILGIRTNNGNVRLLMSASPSNARVHISNLKKENPMTPPMFCMLLRKHLVGGTVIGVSQMGFDRVIRVDVQTRNELGDICTRSVITEIMGRHSNVILVDDENKIMDSAKHIDFTVSGVRQILPGLIYNEPPKQDKTDGDKLSLTDIMRDIENLGEDVPLDRYIVSKFTGMSPLLAREIVYRFCGNTHVFASEVQSAEFSVHLADIIKNLCDGGFCPCIVNDCTKKQPAEFSCIELMQYDGIYERESITSISDVIDMYYERRSQTEHMRQKSSALIKLVSNNIERCEKKIVMHKDNLKKSENRDKYKMYGDLITANIYRIKFGDNVLKTENFYDDEQGVIEIPLKSDIGPSQNAQRYYKKYNKAKTTEMYAKVQIKEAEEEKIYLESVADALEKAETMADLSDIRRELSDEGYIAQKSNKGKNNGKKGKKADGRQMASKPMCFTSVDGYEILVGRNNRQNDQLTLKTAYSTDIWFHTKQIPGSHTIVRAGKEGEVPETTLMQAARLAAFYSKARNSSQVPVDYTMVKNVKKPNGAKPGMVIYDHYNTVYVLPEDIKN